MSEEFNKEVAETLRDLKRDLACKPHRRADAPGGSKEIDRQVREQINSEFDKLIETYEGTRSNAPAPTEK